MAIFGNDDLLRQILGQLGRVSEDLSALKQQVADQQHAIDETRRDANTQIANGLTGNRDAISAGLSDNRAVIREGLEEIKDRFGDSLTRIGADLGTIHDGIDQLNAPATSESAPVADSASAPAPEPDDSPNFEPASEPRPAALTPNSEVLRAAAGIAHAAIQAHRDTWAFLVQIAGNEQHFHIPGKVEDDDGFIHARISGPSLVAAITSLGQVAHTADSPVTQAIADHIHTKITDAVQAIIDNPRTSGNGTPVRIVIDDRAQADEAPDGGEGGDQSNSK
ncbi:hypothetical protein [Streptomyces sp. NPDC002790]|uniref:hypothetical protein n=1 Tax=Streptomyces sp. NPDC002790 TaxID=3154431 RepID=UPI00332D11EE